MVHSITLRCLMVSSVFATGSLVFVFIVGGLASAGCAWAGNYDWSFTACESNQECLDLSDGELDHCGVWEGSESNLCCKRGGYKCACRADGSCEEGATCLLVPNSDADPPHFCYIESIGVTLGAEPVGSAGP